MSRLIAAAVSGLCCLPTFAQTFVPPDAAATCTVTPANFNSWFASGKVSAGGLVRPANSLQFNHDTINPPKTNATINCNFYQWSQQMFLWLTSPTPRHYGGGAFVIDSAIFFDVIEGPNNSLCLYNATLRSNSCGVTGSQNRFRIRVNKPRKSLAVLKGQPNTDAGTGQADGSGDGASLMSQGNKLVYYTTHVNDVYAAYASANSTSSTTLQFPTTQAQLQTAIDWAKKNGRRLPDADALAIELKASWVDAEGMDVSRYVTTMGEVPVFDTSNDKQWVQTGSKQTLLALVGLHVVGSTAGHPEMIWATFEHLTNSPNAAYSYVNKSGKTVNLPAETPRNLLFAANGSKGPFNQEHMYVKSTAPLTIVAKDGFTISASDTQRTFPWGADGSLPLQQGLNAAQANTEVISINNNVHGMLAKGDLRAGYLLIGATWTVGGNNPFDPFTSSNPPPTQPNTFNYAGGNSLANSTMETYVSVKNKLFNCFSCHQNNGQTNVPATVGVSHIYNSIVPYNNSLASPAVTK